MLTGTPRITDTPPVAVLPVQTGNTTAVLTTNGSTASWGTAPVKLATISAINAKNTGLTTIYTVPAGKKLVIDSLIILCTAFTQGALYTTDGSFTLGANDPAYNDYATETSPYLGGVNFACKVVNEMFTTGNGVRYVIYGAGQVIKLNLTVPTDATASTWSINLLGYLYDA